MKAKGEQMERAIQAAGGAEPAPHAVPPKYATAEQMERLIDAIGGGSGYTVEETRTVIIPEQTVTTETGEDFPQVNGYFANVTSSAILPETFPDTILLTADGVEYQLPKLEFSESAVIAYGEIVDMSTIDWSNYPVQVMCIKMDDSDQWIVFVVTETAGTYTVKAESVTRTMTVSPEFQEARGYVVDDAAKGEVILAEETYTDWEEISDDPTYWNVSYADGAPDPASTSFPDAIIVTLDDVPYKVPRTHSNEADEMANYGCLYDSQFPDFPKFFPVAVSFWGGGFELYVQTPGDHTISINAATKEVTTTPDFDAAVAKTTEPLVVTLVPSDPSKPFAGTYVGATADKLKTAFLSGRKIFAKLGNTYITPYILDADALVSDFIYNTGNTVLYIHSVINVSTGANTYHSYAYTGLQELD